VTTTPQIAQIQGGTYQDDLHLYRSEKNTEVPSTTQILDGVGLVDYSNTLEHKARIGDAAHFATRLYDQDDLDPFSLHDEVTPYVQAYMNFVDEMGFVCEPEWIEKSMVHTVNGMSYGLTIDRIGKLTKSPTLSKYRTLLELKCAYAEEASWKWQMSAYEMAVPKDERIVRMALQLKPDGKFRCFPYQNPRDRDVFMWALALTHAKINEGMKWKRERL
jgi:hypothetical protein